MTHAELVAEINRLREALDEYGKHHYVCDVHTLGECDCGYAEAMERRLSD